MSLKITIYSDYICPFCIISKKNFEDAIVGKDIELELIPFEICREGEPKCNPKTDPEVLEMWQEEIIPASNKLGMNLEIPNILPHPYTNLTFQAFHFAKEYSKEKEYSDRVYKAFFYENQDIGEMEVIVKLIGEVGLDKDKCLKALKSGKYKEIQDNYLIKSEQDNIEIVPTIIIGSTRLEGLISKETFEKVIEEELKKK